MNDKDQKLLGNAFLRELGLPELPGGEEIS